MTEFLVRAEIRLPPGMSDDERDELAAREAVRGRELQDSGSIVRIWRVPGRHANVAIWRASDASDLHALLTSLPLFRWMEIEVEALARHPLEL